MLIHFHFWLTNVAGSNSEITFFLYVNIYARICQHNDQLVSLFVALNSPQIMLQSKLSPLKVFDHIWQMSSFQLLIKLFRYAIEILDLQWNSHWEFRHLDTSLTSYCRSSYDIIILLFLLFYGPEGHQHGVSIQSFINLVETTLWIHAAICWKRRSRRKISS